MINRNNLLNPLWVFAGIMLLITAAGSLSWGNKVLAGAANAEIPNLKNMK